MKSSPPPYPTFQYHQPKGRAQAAPAHTGGRSPGSRELPGRRSVTELGEDCARGPALTAAPVPTLLQPFPGAGQPDFIWPLILQTSRSLTGRTHAIGSASHRLSISIPDCISLWLLQGTLTNFSQKRVPDSKMFQKYMCYKTKT